MIDPQAAAAAFRERFGRPAQVVAFAPGRVNLIGEHTDYNEGFVLPIALQLGTTVACARRDDLRICAASLAAGVSAEVDLQAPAERCTGRWTDYIEGVARSVGTPGADLLISSDLPTGAGLSSSAALTVSVATALLALRGASTEALALAQLCQRAEHEFVGTRCGLMDQLAAVGGRSGRALLIDCRRNELEPIPLTLGTARWLVCDTAVKHALATSAYNERRRSCEFAAARLGLASLRDADGAMVERLDEPTLRRRARHVVTENQRTVEAARRLSEGDLTSFGAAMNASHRSLSEDFEVSCAELDFIQRLAAGTPGVYGARMTGGGFGGSLVMLVEELALDGLQRDIQRDYRQAFGRQAVFTLALASEGARVLAATR